MYLSDVAAVVGLPEPEFTLINSVSISTSDLHSVRSSVSTDPKGSYKQEIITHFIIKYKPGYRQMDIYSPKYTLCGMVKSMWTLDQSYPCVS